MKEELNKAMKMIEKTCFNQSYKNYTDNYKKNTKLKKSTAIGYFSGMSMIILSTISNISMINKFISHNDFLMWLNIVLMITGCWLTMSSVFNMIVKDSEKKEMLNENEFIIKELKEETLSFEKIKSLENVMLLIKNKLEKTEFEELLFKTEQKSGKEIGNAYFYYILFSRYEDILNEIKSEKSKKEIVVKKSNALMRDKIEINV